MKVLDLKCAQQHVFEGWFGSEADFQGQLAHGQVECPLCGSVDIQKQLSAPRLNLGVPQSIKSPAPPPLPQAEYLQKMRQLMANTQDVGSDFAEVARQMHYGETEERNIRGQTTPAEAVALLEEGIPVMPLPIPDALKETLQ